MSLLLIVLPIAVLLASFAFVMRGGLGLVKRRFDEEPDLAPSGEDAANDELPVDVDY